MMSADENTAIRLYGDLLIRCIANTIYQDQDSRSGRAYSDALRAEGRDWPSQAHSMIGVKRLENLRKLTEAALEREEFRRFRRDGGLARRSLYPDARTFGSV